MSSESLEKERLDVLGMLCRCSQGSLSILGEGLGFNQSKNLLRAYCWSYSWTHGWLTMNPHLQLMQDEAPGHAADETRKDLA